MREERNDDGFREVRRPGREGQAGESVPCCGRDDSFSCDNGVMEPEREMSFPVDAPRASAPACGGISGV